MEAIEGTPWCKLSQYGISPKCEMEILVLPPEAVSILLQQMTLASAGSATQLPFISPDTVLLGFVVFNKADK